MDELKPCVAPDDGNRCSGLRDGNRCVHGFAAGVGCWPIFLDRVRAPMCCDEERTAELFELNGGRPYPATGCTSF